MIFKFCKLFICFTLFPCCCYFIICIFLSGLPLTYWIKLLLLLTHVLLHEFQRAIPLDSAMLYRYYPLTKYNFKTKFNQKKLLIHIKKEKKLLKYIFLQKFCWQNVWHICNTIFVTWSCFFMSVISIKSGLSIFIITL